MSSKVGSILDQRGIKYAKKFYAANKPAWKHYTPNHVTLSGKKFRTKKADPPFSVIEQALVPKLLALDADSIRLSCTLCRFANKVTGFSYPSKRKLMQKLGYVPYHTNALSGATKVGLNKKQRATRQKQMLSWGHKLDLALQTLIEARLIKAGAIDIKSNDGSIRTSEGYYILREDGSKRNLKQLKFKHATFVIPGWLFDIGALASRTQSKRSGFEPLSIDCIPVLLLALRDNDMLRFGGIDPDRIRLANGKVTLNRFGWPSELPFSIPQFEKAIDELLKRKILKSHSSIFSSSHGQLIERNAQNAEAKSDEVNVVALAFR